MNTILRTALASIAVIGFHLSFAEGAAANASQASAPDLVRSALVDMDRNAGYQHSPGRPDLLKLAQDYPGPYEDDGEGDGAEPAEPADPSDIVKGFITGIMSLQQKRRCDRWADRCDNGDSRACRKYDRRCASDE